MTDKETLRETGVFSFWWLIVGLLIIATAITIAALRPTFLGFEREANVESQQYQDALIRESRSLVQGINNSNSTDQKAHFIDQFCAQFTQIKEPPPDLVTANEEYC